MTNFDALLNILTLDGDTSNEVHLFIAKIDKTILDDNNILYHEIREGISIKLFEQEGIYICKTNNDFIANVEEKHFDKPILILESQKSYDPQSSNNDLLFESVLYEFKFFHLMKEKISLNWDNLSKEFILISDKGKDIIKRQPRHKDIGNIKHSIKNSFENIQEKINQDDRFINFIRNNISLVVETINSEKQYIHLLTNLSLLYKNSIRDYDLFQSKFNFEEFKTGLNIKKREFIKDMQNILHDFHSKISNIPIQFGIYIFLILRFDKERWPLFVTLIIILVWLFFSLKNTISIKDNIDYIQKIYLKDLEDIQNKLPNFDDENTKEEIINKALSTQKSIKLYLITVSTIGVCIALINVYFICINIK